MLTNPTVDTCAAVDDLLVSHVVSSVLTGQVVLLGTDLPAAVWTLKIIELNK